MGVQIRKLSATRVFTPLLYDVTKRPVDHGLYDLAMGPMDPMESYVLPSLMSLEQWPAQHCKILNQPLLSSRQERTKAPSSLLVPQSRR